jgi:hypothetical protein
MIVVKASKSSEAGEQDGEVEIRPFHEMTEFPAASAETLATATKIESTIKRV